MFLAAKFFDAFSDRASALAALARLENVSVQAMDEVNHDSEFILLDAEIDQGGHPAPAHFILLTTPAGVTLYFATGLHLSSTAEGAQMAFVAEYLDIAINANSDVPMVCHIFEFTYRGSVHVLH